MDFQQIRRDAANFIEENKQRIHDNLHSIEFVLMKFNNYIDTFRSVIEGAFPLDGSLIEEIEQKVPRPNIGKIELPENFSNIKNRLISISTRLENELRNYERILNNSLWGLESSAFNQYRSNALSILRREKEFLFNGTCLESIIDTINQEHGRMERGGNTRTLKSAYQKIRSTEVIDDFRKREEDKIFSKVDQITSTYSKYFCDYLNVYQEYYQRFSNGVSPKKETFVTEEREETSGFNVEEEVDSTSVEQETYEMVRKAEPETVSILDEGLEEVDAVENDVPRQEEVNYIKTVTITYNDGYTVTLNIPTESRAILRAELAKLVF